MLQVDAIRILSRLKAAFPSMALTEPQAEVLLNELALLHDPEILDEAVSNLIHAEDRFPPISRIRSAYRSVNERRAMQRQALEASAPASGDGAPEWVAVWSWWRGKTHDARIEANPKNKGKRPEDRLPLEMRDFPQIVEARARDRDMPGVPSPGGSYSWDEYERIRLAWVESGSPLFVGVSVLVGELVGATA